MLLTRPIRRGSRALFARAAYEAPMFVTRGTISIARERGLSPAQGALLVGALAALATYVGLRFGTT